MKALGGSPSMAKASAAHVAHWGLDQPESIAHHIPDEFFAKLLSIPDGTLKIPEVKLEELAQVSRQDRRIRIQFWAEYERSCVEGRKMNFGDVVAGAGIPSWESYQARLDLSPELFAWLMQPPAAYQIQLKEASELGLRRLTDIMELPLTYKDAKGNIKVNTGVGILILQAFKMIDQRLHGAITQKLVNVNLSGDAGEPGESRAVDMAKIDEKIAELERQLEGNVPRGTSDDRGTQVIDVESTPVPNVNTHNSTDIVDDELS